jgi:hypothetical protein
MAGVIYGNTINYPYFGLCIANETYDTPVTAYYDWIFVRKFAGDVESTSSEREDFEPVAHVRGVQSENNFSWASTDNIDSKSYDGGGVGDDFVYGTGAATFNIYNLDSSEEYTLVFTVGDKNADVADLVDNMEITITGADTDTIKVSCDEANSYKKIWISDIFPSATGTISVKFEDTDADNYWAVGELTVEKGDRNIGIRRGDES